MPLTVCAAAVARAPCGRLWALLSDPAAYDSWWDAETVAVVPPGPARPGQVVTFRARGAGRWWTTEMRVDEVETEGHAIRLSAAFPLGIRIRNRISCAPLDARSCRVQFG